MILPTHYHSSIIVYSALWGQNLLPSLSFYTYVSFFAVFWKLTFLLLLSFSSFCSFASLHWCYVLFHRHMGTMPKLLLQVKQFLLTFSCVQLLGPANIEILFHCITVLLPECASEKVIHREQQHNLLKCLGICGVNYPSRASQLRGNICSVTKIQGMLWYYYTILLENALYTCI